MQSNRQLLPPIARSVLLGRGHTPDAKRPIPGRSWLNPPTQDEIRSHVGNIGCRTGEVKDDSTPLWVLDFDAKADGLEALGAWENEHGRIPGWRVRTGSGGLHISLAGLPGQRSRKLPVLDTGLEVELKASGSYVVFAGSIHENGRRYDPESLKGLDVLAPAPEWLLTQARDVVSGLPPSDVGDRIWARGGFRDIPSHVYVEALTGCALDRRRKALCPLHDDHEPTLHVYPDGHWFCSACQLGGRIRQLAAITLGLGHQVEHRWEIESHERQAVAELLARLFSEVER
jgi:hypothetical protein